MSGAIPYLEAIIAASQVLVALSLFFLTYRIHRWEVNRHNELKKREEEVKKRERQLTQDIHSNETKMQRLLKLQEWGNECIDILAQTDHFFMVDAAELDAVDHMKMRNRTLARLSSLIDRGRIFFQNEDANGYGAHKLPAYRGLRPKILDPLVAAYCATNVLRQQGAQVDDQTNQRLIDWRRYFVSLLQQEVGEEWTAMKAISGYSALLGGGAGDNIDERSVAPSEI